MRHGMHLIAHTKVRLSRRQVLLLAEQAVRCVLRLHNEWAKKRFCLRRLVMRTKYIRRKLSVGRGYLDFSSLMVAVLMLFKSEADGFSQTLFNYDPAGNLTIVSASGSGGPSITAQSQPELIESNALVTLSIVASGPGLTYQWLSNGVPIIGATGDSLVLTNLPMVNSTNYSVIISNYSGSITSAPVALWADSNGNGIPDWWEMQYFEPQPNS